MKNNGAKKIAGKCKEKTAKLYKRPKHNMAIIHSELFKFQKHLIQIPLTIVKSWNKILNTVLSFDRDIKVQLQMVGSNFDMLYLNK